MRERQLLVLYRFSTKKNGLYFYRTKLDENPTLFQTLINECFHNVGSCGELFG